MKSMRVFFVLIASVILFGFSNSLKQENGIRMSIQGKVIDKDKNTGVADVLIIILNPMTGETHETTSESDGCFRFEAVRAGYYEVINGWIYSSLRKIKKEYLVLESESDKNLRFNVIEGKNTVDFNIFLIKGSSISGRVFGPDGKSPMSNAEISFSPSSDGQGSTIQSDSNGNFFFQGLKKRKDLQDGVHSHCIVVQTNGYADVAVFFDVEKNGEDQTGLNIVLGRGSSSISGRVIDIKTWVPINNARIEVMSEDGSAKSFISGRARTDSNGEFSIIGFQRSSSKFIIGIFYNNTYKEFSRELKIGENRFVFEFDEDKEE